MRNNTSSLTAGHLQIGGGSGLWHSSVLSTAIPQNSPEQLRMLSTKEDSEFSVLAQFSPVNSCLAAGKLELSEPISHLYNEVSTASLTGT